MYKTLGLVRISVLISAITKSFWVFLSVKLFYKSNRKLFSCVCIAWYKHERGWENSRQFCATVKSSPNTSSVYIRLCKHWQKVFYCFYKITFPRKKKNSFFRLLIKRETLTSRQVLYTKLNVRVISFCSARWAKHLDSTHVYILSCKHTSRPIRARAYYLSYL